MAVGAVADEGGDVIGALDWLWGGGYVSMGEMVVDVMMMLVIVLTRRSWTVPQKQVAVARPSG